MRRRREQGETYAGHDKTGASTTISTARKYTTGPANWRNARGTAVVAANWIAGRQGAIGYTPSNVVYVQIVTLES